MQLQWKIERRNIHFQFPKQNQKATSCKCTHKYSQRSLFGDQYDIDCSGWTKTKKRCVKSQCGKISTKRDNLLSWYNYLFCFLYIYLLVGSPRGEPTCKFGFVYSIRSTLPKAIARLTFLLILYSCGSHAFALFISSLCRTRWRCQCR